MADETSYDLEGNKLPFKPNEVRQKMDEMIEKGEIMLVIIKDGNDLGVQVFGPPSQELIDIMEQALAAYRQAVADAKQGKMRGSMKWQKPQRH